MKSWPILILIALSWMFVEQELPQMEEICNNAIDDDGDGLIDLNDPDCECPPFEPISLIPNPSFEDQDCCPSTISQMDCATGWRQASEATSDYLHTCDWLGWSGLEPPLPFPDGEGIAGYRDGRFTGPDAQHNWKEYIGACLLAPMKAREKYRIKFHLGFTYENNSPPVTVVFYGTTTCDSLPFGVGDQNFGCPTNNQAWVLLDSVQASGVEEWIVTEVELNPREDINAIAIGAPCRPFFWPYENYYFVDNLVLAEEKFFTFAISGTGSACSENYKLSVPDIFENSYQWYKDGIALVGETSNEVIVGKNQGRYQVQVINGTECQVTEPFIHSVPADYVVDEKTICEGEAYPLGNQMLSQAGQYMDTLISSQGCDSIVTVYLEIQSNTRTASEVTILKGQSYELGGNVFDREGNFTVTIPSSNGCDSIIDLTIKYVEAFIPNAFSPNGDGINDYFTVQGGEGLSKLISLKVFDRWGNMVYIKENTAIGTNQGWDGNYQGQQLENGTYIYQAIIATSDGEEKIVSGAVALIR